MLIAATATISKDDTVKAMQERGREMSASPGGGTVAQSVATSVAAPATAKTQLGITQMGGQKNYSVRGKEPKLIEFMDAINGKLG